MKTLTELREWNTAHEKMGAIKYGQSQLDISDKMDLEKDRARYEEDRARDIRLGGTTGIDAALKANNLDALLFPGPSSAGIAAKPGYPTVIVPFGMIPNTPGNLGGGGGRGGRGDAPPAAPGASSRRAPPRQRRRAAGDGRGATPPPPFPPGFDPKPQPYGVGFTGTRVQRADAAAPGLRVRAGDEEADAAAGTAISLKGREGGAAAHYQITSTLYFRKTWSFVTTGRRSACAWATINRSNGSR